MHLLHSDLCRDFSESGVDAAGESERDPEYDYGRHRYR